MTSLGSAHRGRPLDRWLKWERVPRGRDLRFAFGPLPKLNRPIDGARWIERALQGIRIRLTGPRGGAPRTAPPLNRMRITAGHSDALPRGGGPEGAGPPPAPGYPRFSDDARLTPGALPWPAPDQLSEAARLAVREAIARLPGAHRTALVLGDVEGLSSERVAAVLGRPVEAARRLRHEARLAIMEALDEILAGSR